MRAILSQARTRLLCHPLGIERFPRWAGMGCHGCPIPGGTARGAHVRLPRDEPSKISSTTVQAAAPRSMCIGGYSYSNLSQIMQTIQTHFWAKILTFETRSGDSIGIKTQALIKEHHLKGYARTGICKILPYYRDMGPNFWSAKGLDRPEIGLV